MKKLIVTFFILCGVFIITCVVFKFYIYAVPVFAELLAPLIGLSVAAGVLALLFTGIAIYKELKNKHE